MNKIASDSRLWSVAVIAVLAIIFQSFPEPLQSHIDFDRNAIRTGEYWRLLTGHTLHLGWIHLGLNLAGLVLILALFWREWRSGNFWFAFLISLLFVNLGLWFFSPEVRWYVGLSGVLHGLLMAGAILSFRHERGFALAVMAVTSGKIAWEQISGSDTGTAALIGGQVIVDAHAYGFTGGILAGALLWLLARH
jgi:rhomboid family GlyGly-CTERM serine protease